MGLQGSTALVTGANGFVGTRTARRLAALGVHVRALVRRPGEREELGVDGIEEVGGDFADREDALRTADGADFVVHCAATVGQDLADARRVNVEGTRAVIEAARATGARRLVHISTISVYDLAGHEIVDEDCPFVTGGHQYGLSKAEGDRLVLDAAAGGLPATVLRPGAILGAHPTSSWAAKMPAKIREGEHKLMGDGANILMLLHVEDLVDAILLALQREEALGRAYNVADHHETWRAFTDRVRGWFGSPPLDAVPESEIPEGAYWTGRVSNERIRSELGYRAKRTYDEGMDEAEAYWRERAASAPRERTSG